MDIVSSNKGPGVFKDLGFNPDEVKKLVYIYRDQEGVYRDLSDPKAPEFFREAEAQGFRLSDRQKRKIFEELFGGNGEAGKKAATQSSFKSRISSSFLDECWEELEAFSPAAVGYYDDGREREIAFNEIVDKGEKAGMSPSEVAEDAHLHYLDVVSGKAVDDRDLFGAPDEPENMRYDDQYDDDDPAEYVGWDYIGESRRPYRRARQLRSSVNNMSYSAWRRELMEWLEDNHPRSAYLVKKGGVTEEELRELYEDYNPEDASAMIYMYYEDDPEYRRLMGQSRGRSRLRR